MNEFLISVLIIIIVIGISFLIYSYFFKNRSSCDVDVTICSFSFNRHYRNAMSEDKGDKEYFYLSNNKVVVKLYGYGREEVIDKETKINTKEYLFLKSEIIVWIDKYDVYTLAKDEFVGNILEPEIQITDVSSGFEINIYDCEFNITKVTNIPNNYIQMLNDLETIFKDFQ